MTSTYRFTIATAEADLLRNLAEQLIELVDAADAADPALERLSPGAYPDDAGADAEFRRLTRGDLLMGRSHQARVMVESLGERSDAAQATDDYTCELSAGDVTAWMRTLASLRLVIATRLGIGQHGSCTNAGTSADNDSSTDPDPDPDHAPGPDDAPQTALYDWLGYRLELLIHDTDDDAAAAAPR